MSTPVSRRLLRLQVTSSYRQQQYYLLRRLTLLAAVLLAAGLNPFGHVYLNATESAERPNIVLILADDLGVHDVGCYRADLVETPHIDQLAGTGIRFTQACSPSPVCTPTRAALLTGRHPARLRMTIWSEGSVNGPQDRRLLQAESRHDLPLTEVTLAKHLQNAGYLTASIGKWHLGDAAHAPESHGFDINMGGNHWGAPQTYFWPYRGSRHYGGEFRYVPHLAYGRQGEYLTDRLTAEALRVIDYAVETKQPFFLYLSHYAPHTPIEARQEDIDYFEQKLRPEMQHRNAAYAAMIRSLDSSVGQVVEHLQAQQLLRNTVIVFASDNGGYIAVDRSRDLVITSNSPLRSGKGSLYEGGIRVPLIISWPEHIPKGSETAQMVVLTDLFPTLLTLTGLTQPSDLVIDGCDLTPLLQNPDELLDRDTLYFHYPHYYHDPQTAPCSAIRSGDWKLIEHFEGQPIELYDLSADPGEIHNLAAAQPAIVEQLQADLRNWRNDVSAALPSPNPAWTGE